MSVLLRKGGDVMQLFRCDLCKMLIEDRKQVVVTNVYYYDREEIERSKHFDLCRECALKLFRFSNLDGLEEKEKEVKEGGDSSE